MLAASPDTPLPPPCSSCGREVEPPAHIAEVGAAVARAVGWCAPSATVYAHEDPVLCGDCRGRLIFITELGIDPGQDGENLRATRGGIQYGRQA